MTEPLSRPLVALIGCSDEWMCRSLESVFEEKGFEVTRAGSGRQVLKLARDGSYDVVMLDERMDELAAVDVCIALRDDPLFDHATPIVITSSAHATPKTRAAAYAAGAWEYCQQPLDVEGLFMKLATFLRARHELEVAQSKCLTDPASGLYTSFGLEQVSEQLGARALRKHEAFACVTVSAQPTHGKPGDTTTINDRGGFADIRKVVRSWSRKSDIIAQTGEARLAILAPETDAAGARMLLGRLQKELDAASKNTSIGGSVRLRAGFCAVPDFAAANVNLRELVHRAESALEQVPFGANVDGILSFDDLPLS